MKLFFFVDPHPQPVGRAVHLMGCFDALAFCVTRGNLFFFSPVSMFGAGWGLAAEGRATGGRRCCAEGFVHEGYGVGV